MADVDPQSEQGKPPEEASTVEPEIAVRSPKNLYVCCDGTGNEFHINDGNSNVVKLYTALDLNPHNLAYYHPGVGTLGDPTKKGLAKEWSVLCGLAFGRGFRDNVLDAYRYLMQHYAAGDRVFLFGFSRGAYTARALAGLLHGYGLLCRGNEGHIPYAWRMYTDQLDEQQLKRGRSISTDTTFRDTFSHRDFSIYFVGLWDTVSSVGWVSNPLRLLDMAQNPLMQRGRHAISIDERRCFYQDNIWGPPVPVDTPNAFLGEPRPADLPVMQDIRQVWFAGVHSDVGGSYTQETSGLANITLEWMLDEAEKAGANICPERKRLVLGELESGEPTPPNAALAPLYPKPKHKTLHRSLRGPWWPLEFLPHRYYAKDNSKVIMRIPLGAYRLIPQGALIHPSVRERFQKHPCYKPKNITAEEIIDAPPDAGVGADEPYLVFKPDRCRSYAVRQNIFVVFLVMILETGVPLYALLCLGRLARKHHWCRHTWQVLRCLWRLVKHLWNGRFASAVPSVRTLLWFLVAVAVVIVTGKLIGLLRRRFA